MSFVQILVFRDKEFIFGVNKYFLYILTGLVNFDILYLASSVITIEV